MPARTDLANAIRALSMDAVQQAASGHPGAPMGMADIAQVLWCDYLVHNPANPAWPNRDRFVLSNGHASMLIYSLLHLSGYDLPMDELRRFRQLDSKTPGHPEHGHTPGVETTTGPLGQGLANAVGMAIAEKTLAAQFNTSDHRIVDHYTYVFVGDGCLMEGVSHEACSLAGTLGLGKLIVFYDDNGISIDGAVSGWFTDDTDARFAAYGWQTLAADGHDPAAIATAIDAARADDSRPSIIRCRTTIGFGSPAKQGSAAAHGAPLGADEVAAARRTLGWLHEPFEIPAAIREAWDATERGERAELEWKRRLIAFEEDNPVLAMEFARRVKGEIHKEFSSQAESFSRERQAAADSVATRQASRMCLDAFAPLLPELIGGSADLSGSNLTTWSGSESLVDNARGNYIYYGVREFAMTAIATGLALHGGFIPYTGTFLIFMEYGRNAARMAALMKQRSIFVYTHDSIGQGEDGPTHQPVEQLANLRLTPNMSLWRPADAVETAVAWRAALERRDGPTALALTRQKVSPLARSDDQLAAVARGAYVLRDCAGTPEAIVIATGSEVALCEAAVATVQAEGIRARLVSMPSVDVFEAQDPAYRESVLPAAVTARIAVEAAAADYWHKFVGPAGTIIGMASFGASAPGEQLMERFGFTPQRVADAIRALVRARPADG